MGTGLDEMRGETEGANESEEEPTDSHAHHHHHKHLESDSEDEEVKLRKQTYAKALLRAFKPVSIYAMIFGRFPLIIEKKKDGSSRYVTTNTSFNTIYFVFTTFIITFLALGGSIGFALMLGLDDGLPDDYCSQSWVENKISALVVPVVVTWSWIILTFYGSIYMFFHGVDYAHYINYWKRAIFIMDMDVSGRARYVGLYQIIVSGVLLAVFTACYCSFKVDEMTDAAGIIALAVVRAFKKEIQGPTLDIDKKTGIKVYCTKWTSYHAWTALGFMIQIYGLLASQAFMLQFRFFCCALRQAAETWCQRFQNAMNKVEMDPKDDTKRRLALKEVLKDHLVIVMLFKLTDVTFGLVLLCYYFVIVVAFCFELFYLYSGITFEGCHHIAKTVDGILDDCKSKGQVPTCSAYGAQRKRKQGVNFDGCTKGGALVDSLVTFFFLFQTIGFFLNITVAAANASEAAMQGYQILRRHGFMYCRRRKERNFIQSLVISYTHNNPMVLTASGYFHLTRALIVNVILAVVTWFVIVIQLRDLADVGFVPGLLCTKPGETDSGKIPWNSPKCDLTAFD